MDYSTSTEPTPEKKETSLAEHASNAWSGFTSMFKSSSPTPAPAPAPTATMGGRRKYVKSMKGGKSKKSSKSLCKGKQIYAPNKCKKLRGCKVASGKKRSFCRKSKNHTKKTK